MSVGQGKLTIEDVRQMFLEPSPASYPKKLELAPACGLYLADIFYDPADMALPESEQTTEGSYLYILRSLNQLNVGICRKNVFQFTPLWTH